MPHEDPRYPIGRYAPPAEIGRADLDSWIADLEALPGRLRDAVAALDDAQLDTPLRAGGWTVRQVVHHLADGHMNMCLRFRVALTEERPSVTRVDIDAWAVLPDARDGPVEPSLLLIDGLHRRWTGLLRSLSDADFKRCYFHPGDAEWEPLDGTLGYLAWHCRHHVAQILAVGERHGW